MIGDSAEKVSCYEDVNGIENVGNCDCEDKSRGQPLFRPACTVDSPGTAGVIM